jgi:hypothetical protein
MRSFRGSSNVHRVRKVGPKSSTSKREEDKNFVGIATVEFDQVVRLCFFNPSIPLASKYNEREYHKQTKPTLGNSSE